MFAFQPHQSGQTTFPAILNERTQASANPQRIGSVTSTRRTLSSQRKPK